jgi:hypothetical protein
MRTPAYYIVNTATKEAFFTNDTDIAISYMNEEHEDFLVIRTQENIFYTESNEQNVIYELAQEEEEEDEEQDDVASEDDYED